MKVRCKNCGAINNDVGYSLLIKKVMGVDELHLKSLQDIIKILVNREIERQLPRRIDIYWRKHTSVFDKDISKLDISMRLKNSLERGKYYTIADLFKEGKLRTKELLRLRGFGLKSLEELRIHLIEHGFGAEEST